MQIIIKIISLFIGLFIITNGVWVILTPPFGDEPIACVIIAVGNAGVRAPPGFFGVAQAVAVGIGWNGGSEFCCG